MPSATPSCRPRSWRMRSTPTSTTTTSSRSSRGSTSRACACVPNGEWLPYRYLLFPPAIAAGSGHELDDRWVGWALAATLWRHYGAEVDSTLAKDAKLAQAGDVDGLIDHVKLRAKRLDSAVPSEEDLLRNIVSERAIQLAL